MATYTVKKDDTLSDIAWKYNSTYKYGNDSVTACKRLADINDIDPPYNLAIGQVLKLDNPSGSISKPKTKSNKATIKQFGLQSGSDSTIFASWTWTKEHTENYKVKWSYDTGDGVWFVGSDSTTEYKQSTYSMPSNAKRIKFIVKPVSTKHTVNEKETSYWTAEWSTVKYYDAKDVPPSKPSAPNVTINKGNKLTAKLENINIGNVKEIQFQIYKNDRTFVKSGKAKIITSTATYTTSVAAGSRYKVRCRGVRGKVYGEWSDYSSNSNTIPSSPAKILRYKALSETSVYLDWANVANAKTYEVQYTTKKSYFDSSSEVQSTTVDATAAGHAEITGLESGETYFFRVRAINDEGKSPWSEIVSITVGKAPSAPTTWSSTTTVITGESLTLYWVHNSEDGSSQTYAELELTIDGQKTTQKIKNTTDEDEKDKTSSYVIDTSTYTEGSKIQWRVRTAGITGVYGDWSVERVVDIYAPAVLELSVTNSSGDMLETLTSFPFYVSGLAGPNTQLPIGYHLSIISNEVYQTVDQVGNEKIVNVGEEVYSKYFDTSNNPLLVEFSAGNIDLENNISYTVKCTSSMDSGLRAEASVEFDVSWVDDEYVPNAEISYDADSYTASIRPYCVDEDENLISDITLSVYRREFDGSFVEIASGLDNTENTYVTDPHPALDYARYRIVAITNSTGAVSYYDVPGYPVGEVGAIIQWDEEWTSFDSSSENEADASEQPAWSGSLLKLPYNVDVSDKNSMDVSLVKYIGRKRPVSYYGTQLGESSSWKMDIPKDDKDTLYALRRLAIWPGDVYVRESSGSGYWANIKVSFSQTHNEVIIPVSLDITRVEGGI